MTKNILNVEELDGGLKAVFINMPHFRTSSARLTINSGSLHENIKTAGAAHFLEHVTLFQGTKGLPSKDDVYRYKEDNGVYLNAFTSQTYTTFVVDGYDLKPVGYLLSQVVLFPLLQPEGLEKERKPIIEEARGRASSPYFLSDMAHDEIIRGKRYARPIVGSLDDIERMNHKHLTDYYKKNYRLSNAVLVICSNEPIDRQREYVRSLLKGIKYINKDESTPVNLPNFNPKKLKSSLQLLNLPKNAQTTISIKYELPKTKNIFELFSQRLVGIGLSKLVYRRLRGELALCYDAWANTYGLSNLNFSSDQNWSYMSIGAGIEGSDAIEVLDKILEVILKKLPKDIIETMLIDTRRYSDRLMENNPMAIADFVRDTLAYSRINKIDLEEGKKFANTISLNELRKIHQDMIQRPPLIVASSPDPVVLKKIGKWTETKF